MTGVHLFLSLVDQRLLTYIQDSHRILTMLHCKSVVNQFYIYIYIYILLLLLQFWKYLSVIDYRGLEFKIGCIFLY